MWIDGPNRSADQVEPSVRQRVREMLLDSYVDSGDGSRKVNTTLGKLPLRTAVAALNQSPFEGADVVNLGSRGIGAEDFLTMAWGIRLPLAHGLSLGGSYERPLSSHEDIWEQRVTMMLTWEL